jgi:hypothetical protein
MKKSIPFATLLRAIRYCSTFVAYLRERESLRIALLLNKHPANFIDNQFNHLISKYELHQLFSSNNYNVLRRRLIESPIQDKMPKDHGKTMFIDFTYCTAMRYFPFKFHTLRHTYFEYSPINEVTPILGTRNVDNLQRHLVHIRHQ